MLILSGLFIGLSTEFPSNMIWLICISCGTMAALKTQQCKHVQFESKNLAAMKKKLK
jgi:hypothetical protein